MFILRYFYVIHVVLFHLKMTVQCIRFISEVFFYLSNIRHPLLDSMYSFDKLWFFLLNFVILMHICIPFVSLHTFVSNIFVQRPIFSTVTWHWFLSFRHALFFGLFSFYMISIFDITRSSLNVFQFDFPFLFCPFYLLLPLFIYGTFTFRSSRSLSSCNLDTV